MRTMGSTPLVSLWRMATHQTNLAALQASVRRLRHELADKDRRIAQLQSQLARLQAGAPDRPPPAGENPPPGSRADLLAQLDTLYQEK